MTHFEKFRILLKGLKISFDNELVLKTVYEMAVKCEKGEEITAMDFAMKYKSLHDDVEKKIKTLQDTFNEEQLEIIEKTFLNR